MRARDRGEKFSQTLEAKGGERAGHGHSVYDPSEDLFAGIPVGVALAEFFDGDGFATV